MFHKAQVQQEVASFELKIIGNFSVILISGKYNPVIQVIKVFFFKTNRNQTENPNVRMSSVFMLVKHILYIVYLLNWRGAMVA